MPRRPYTRSVDPESGATMHNFTVSNVKLVLAMIGQILGTMVTCLTVLWLIAEPRVVAAVKQYDQQEIAPRLERRFERIDRDREEQDRRWEKALSEIKDDVKWLVREKQSENAKAGGR